MCVAGLTKQGYRSAGNDESANSGRFRREIAGIFEAEQHGLGCAKRRLVYTTPRRLAYTSGMEDIPLGKATAYPAKYAPEVLYPIPRAESREPIGIDRVLPFRGADLWTAWELTWLDERGKPAMAAARIRVPASSPNIIESKSLKLYLNSFAMTGLTDEAELVAIVEQDLSAAAGDEVLVSLFRDANVGELPGDSLDDLDADCSAYEVDPDLLVADSGDVISATWRTGLLRSLCPVTSQPDFGSVMIRYEGPRIDPASLLRYVVSFREHEDFHEACVERMFNDIKTRCASDRLTVYARYQRRGGLDINPFRSDFESEFPEMRLWNQ